MGSKRDGLADALEPTLRDTSPQARHHFTQADQVNQLVGASEAEPDRRAAIRSAPRHTTPIWPGRLMFDHRSVCRVEHSQVLSEQIALKIPLRYNRDVFEEQSPSRAYALL